MRYNKITVRSTKNPFAGIGELHFHMNKRPNPYLLTVVSGILLVLAFPPFNMWFLAWIALVPFLYAIATSGQQKQKKGRMAFLESQAYGQSAKKVLCFCVTDSLMI